MTVCQAFTGDHGEAHTFTPFFTASWAIFSCVWLEALETSPVSSMRSLCRESPAPLTVSQSNVSSEEVSEFHAEFVPNPLMNGTPDIQNVRMLWGRSAAINENYQTIWNSLPDSLIQELYTLDIDDFESGDLKANMKPPGTAVPSVDSAPSGIVEAGGGRSSDAFHWKTSSSNGHWPFLGMRLDSTAKNWEHLDSVVYYVRGSGEYSFGIEAFDELSGKALFFDSLRTEWTRVRVRSSDFVAADSNGGNIGWYLVRQKVTNITFSAIGNAEIWIDDVRIYGLNRDDVE